MSAVGTLCILSCLHLVIIFLVDLRLCRQTQDNLLIKIYLPALRWQAKESVLQGIDSLGDTWWAVGTDTDSAARWIYLRARERASTVLRRVWHSWRKCNQARHLSPCTGPLIAALSDRTHMQNRSLLRTEQLNLCNCTLHTMTKLDVIFVLPNEATSVIN